MDLVKGGTAFGVKSPKVNTVMKTTLIISFAGLVVSLVGCKAPSSHVSATEVRAIERVFAADAEAYKRTIGRTLTPKSTDPETAYLNRAITPGSLVGQYASALREISFAGVPNEFHSAYMEHIHAWESMQGVLQRKPEKGDPSLLLDIGLAIYLPQLGLPALLKDARASDRSSSELDHEKRAASDQIRVTWNKIEVFAVGRGAKIPKPLTD